MMEEIDKIREITEAIFRNLENRGAHLSKELKIYLVDDAGFPLMDNIFTYQELIWGDDKGIPEPLKFFEALYAACRFVIQTKATPNLIVERLDGMNNIQKHFFLVKLMGLIRTNYKDIEKDEELKSYLVYLSGIANSLRNSLSGKGQTETRQINQYQEYVRELETYINNKLNLKIYKDLTEGDNAGLYNPLNFFRLLYESLQNLQSYKYTPLTFDNNLKSINLTDKQRHYLLQHLNDLIETRIKELKGQAVSNWKKSRHFRSGPRRRHQAESQDREAEQLGICQDFIKTELDRPHEKLFDEPAQLAQEENIFNFDAVKQHLEILPDTQAKIRYLIEIKTDFRQQDAGDQFPLDFEEKCDRELFKLRRYMALDDSSKGQGNPEIKNEAVTRNSAHTLARQMIAMHFLLEYAKAKCTNKAKADFIAFLTSKDPEGIRQKLSSLYQTKEDNYPKWEEDMKYVQEHFKALKLSEIVKMIENELNSEIS